MEITTLNHHLSNIRGHLSELSVSPRGRDTSAAVLTRVAPAALGGGDCSTRLGNPTAALAPVKKEMSLGNTTKQHEEEGGQS
jgi:hypothetical protein